MDPGTHLTDHEAEQRHLARLTAERDAALARAEKAEADLMLVSAARDVAVRLLDRTEARATRLAAECAASRGCWQITNIDYVVPCEAVDRLVDARAAADAAGDLKEPQP